jgi:hypothetical protein
MRKIKKTMLKLLHKWWKSADSPGVWIWVVSAPQDELGKRTATVEQKTEDQFAYISVASAATIEYCLMIEQVHSQILWWNKRSLNSYYEILTLSWRWFAGHRHCRHHARGWPLYKSLQDTASGLRLPLKLSCGRGGGGGVPISTRGQTLWYFAGKGGNGRKILTEKRHVQI